MNADDEQLLRGRVYGHDHDDPNEDGVALVTELTRWPAGPKG